MGLAPLGTMAERPLWSESVARRAARRMAWMDAPSVLALYLPGALAALASAVPIAAAMEILGRTTPWPAELVSGDVLHVLVDALGAQRVQGDSRTFPPEVAEAALPVTGAFVMALGGVIVQSVAYTFVLGGVLTRRISGGAGPFWRGCRGWFWPMFRFGLLALPLFALMLAPGVALARLIDPTLTWGVVLLGVWVSVANGVLELGRATMVRHHSRRAARGLLAGVRSAARLPVLRRALPLWALLAAAGSAQLALSGVAFGVPGGVIVFLLAQQALALLGAWLKYLRLSAAVSLTGESS